VADCYKQNNDCNVIQSEQEISAFKIKKVKLLLQNQIAPDVPDDKGVDAVEGKKNKDDAEKN